MREPLDPVIDRRRRAAQTVLLVLVGLSIVYLALAAWNPWHLRLLRWQSTVFVVPLAALATGGWLLLAAWGILRPALGCVGALLGVMCAIVGSLSLLVAVELTPLDGRDVSQVASPDGHHRLVLVVMPGLVDPNYEVRLRSGRTPLVREVLVASLPPDGDEPVMRFTGPHAIEVIDDTGTVYRATFRLKSLKVDPVHRV